jgi:hypothetical protein
MKVDYIVNEKNRFKNRKDQVALQHLSMMKIDGKGPKRLEKVSLEDYTK